MAEGPVPALPLHPDRTIPTGGRVAGRPAGCRLQPHAIRHLITGHRLSPEVLAKVQEGREQVACGEDMTSLDAG